MRLEEILRFLKAVKLLKFILLPLSALYGLGAAFRNLAYDRGWRRSFSFELPVISIGNLAVGGTGKTPHIEYLTELLQSQYPIAILSRGYKRKTFGFVMGNSASTAADVGDEPAQYIRKFPKAAVAVGEDRVFAIPLLLAEAPSTQVLLLDDAFQHRPVQPGLNILLTEYHQLYIYDWPMPAGRLREFRSGYQRADIIVVTKCPSDLSLEKQNLIRKQLNPLPHQQVFFSSVTYGHLKPVNDTLPPTSMDTDTDVLLVTGIAQPKPLYEHLVSKTKSVTHLPFPDHHHFTEADLTKVQKTFNTLSNSKKIIITTEKDVMRLVDTSLNASPLYYLPIKVVFLNNAGATFDQSIWTYISNTIDTKPKEQPDDIS